MTAHMIAVAALLAGSSALAQAENLYHPGSWPSLASDRVARQAGDTLTVIVYENSSASDSATTGSARNAQLQAGLTAGSLNKSGGLSLNGGSQNNGSTGRSGQMVAQISVKVSGVEPNGDLDVTGEQDMHISREHTIIRIKGRVRPADVSSTNTVASSRIADAQIDYDGSGFVSRSGRPGILTRIFNFLGLM